MFFIARQSRAAVINQNIKTGKLDFLTIPPDVDNNLLPVQGESSDTIDLLDSVDILGVVPA